MTAATYTPKAFPVQVYPDFVPQRELRSSGTECPTSSSGYTQAGVHYSGARPILYQSFDEARAQADGTTLAHHALDITCAPGSLIVAPVAGRGPETVVVRGQRLPGAGQSSRGGNYVWLVEPSGYSHYFAHMLESAKVRPGQSVRAGEIIGLCGRTGNAEGGCAHLHYAVTDARGVKVNPYGALLPLYQAGGWQRPKPPNWWLWTGLGLAAAGVLGYGLYRWSR